MSQVLTGVMEKLQDLLPGQIGDNRRWSTAEVNKHIMFADGLVRERTENHYHEQEITLISGRMEYNLDVEFINVVSVEFSTDGSLYDDYLVPVALDDLDKINLWWRQDGGTEPEFYTLLGAPGINAGGAQVVAPNNSKILIYRPIPSVSAQTIRVRGNGIAGTTAQTPDAIQNKCHVPHVMAVLLAKDNANKAVEWLGKYKNGCDEIRRMTRNRLVKAPSRIKVGW